MKKTFYCPICQDFRDGKVTDVIMNRVNDIATIYCPHCGESSICYFSAGTIPKITVPEKPVPPSDGPE